MKIIYTAIFVLFWTIAIFCDAEIKASDKGNNAIVPSYFIGLQDNVILVEKSIQKLYLYDKDYKLIKTFNVTTGQRQGDKKGQGDRKTPEGIYFFTLVKEDKELFPQYGVMALPINYPNFIDTLSRKNGNGIWLHATNQPTRPLTPFDTKGCVVAVNEDILELAEHIKLQTTPIVIVDKVKYNTFQEITENRKEVYQLIEKWKNSWEKKDIDTYMDSYSINFKTNGMDWIEWKKYKNRLNQQYTHINISLSNMQIFRYNDHIIASFVQNYKSNRITRLGIKRLYFINEADDWKILGEEWMPIPIQQPAIIAQKYVAHKEKITVKAEPAPKQKVASSSSKAPLIDIEDFIITEEKTATKIKFKLVNKTIKQHKLTGRLAIIAANRTNQDTFYSSYPRIPLEQGIPLNFKEGEWFSIKRFKIVNGDLDNNGFDIVTVLVYSQTGEILLKKNFPVQIQAKQ